MKAAVLTNNPSKIEVTGARLSIGAAVATLLLLVILHVLSPEFDPSFRMVSEYALGQYGSVLSLMFLAWGINSWALAAALWSQVKTKAGKVGWWFLVIAGIGEALASVFDITHDTGHSIAGMLGVGGFPIAALLLSVSLGRLQEWSEVKKPLLWIANLSWISVVLLGGNISTHDGSIRPDKSRPTASARTGTTSSRRVGIRWMGRQADHPGQLFVGTCCRLAGDEVGRAKVPHKSCVS